MSSSTSITAASSSSFWIPKPSPSKLPKFQPCYSFPPSSPPCCRAMCRSESPQHAPSSSTDLKFALHDALDSSGIDTSHARVLPHSHFFHNLWLIINIYTHTHIFDISVFEKFWYEFPFIILLSHCERMCNYSDFTWTWKFQSQIWYDELNLI